MSLTLNFNNFNKVVHLKEGELWIWIVANRSFNCRHYTPFLQCAFSSSVHGFTGGANNLELRRNYCGLTVEVAGSSWFQLQGQTHLVTSGLEVLAVNHGGERQGHAVLDLLLESETHLRLIVYFGPDRRA